MKLTPEPSLWRLLIAIVRLDAVSEADYIPFGTEQQRVQTLTTNCQ